MRVQSEVGRGTTVTLYLPRSAEVSVARTAPAGVAVATPPGDGRVLLVEDDDSVAALVTEMLRELGYAVTRAASASIALRLLEVEPVDLVFSDMVMPGRMNGMDLAREIGVRRPGLPVVLTTGYSQAASAAREQGFRLVMKPYRMDALAAILADALAPAAI